MFGLPLLLAIAAAVLPTGSRPAAQQTATVRGRVVIDIPPSSRRPSSAYPSRAVAPAQLAPPTEVENVVVYLKDAPASNVSPRRTAIRQRGETFLPRVVAVPLGSTVDFPNDDPIFHNVFSLSRARTFNLGRFPRGESRAVRFDKTGIVKVFCDIHSHMAATVVVFNHPWFAGAGCGRRLRARQTCRPADRQVTAWHERLGETTLRIRTEARADGLSGVRAAGAGAVSGRPGPLRPPSGLRASGRWWLQSWRLTRILRWRAASRRHAVLALLCAVAGRSGLAPVDAGWPASIVPSTHNGDSTADGRHLRRLRRSAASARGLEFVRPAVRAAAGER